MNNYRLLDIDKFILFRYPSTSLSVWHIDDFAFWVIDDIILVFKGYDMCVINETDGGKKSLLHKNKTNEQTILKRVIRLYILYP